MSRIGLDEVRRVARLARLSLSEDETQQMQARLDAILDYMATLERLDTSDVPPTYHALEMICPLRADEVVQPLRREEILRATAKSDAGAFAVPKVMEGE